MQDMALSLFILLAGGLDQHGNIQPNGGPNPLRVDTTTSGLPVLGANDPEDKNSPFYYDWHSLRVGGLICAGVLCAVGIIVLMSGKCKCRFSQKPSHRPVDVPPLITPGSANNC